MKLIIAYFASPIHFTSDIILIYDEIAIVNSKYYQYLILIKLVPK